MSDSRSGTGGRQDVSGVAGRPIGRAVAIGGGHGLSRCLEALTRVADHVTAVVTVADDGGSSGRLRQQLGVLPPGDLRMAMAALSPRPDLAELVQYRFAEGELEGHSLGNLVIVAAADLEGGDVVAGLDWLGGLLEIGGRVLPCTTQPLHLRARVDDGEVSGQVTVARSKRVQRVWLDPEDPPATPGAVEALRQADVIVLGPGSLFTSIIPNLLVPGIAGAVSAARCPVVLVANLRQQQGETEGLDLAGHLSALLDHALIRLDAIVAHDGPAEPGDGVPLLADRDVLTTYAKRVVFGDLLDPRGGHEPGELARLLAAVVRPERLK